MAVRFEILEGPDAGRTFEYPANTSFVVGRGATPSADLQLPSDPYMSRYHFLVIVGVDDCVLRDCGSSNGLFVNGERRTEVAVADGDQVRAGHTTMVVRLPSAGAKGPAIPAPSRQEVEERFEILTCIAPGSLAPVYKALDRRSGEAVALKFLRIDMTAADERMPVFRRELDAAMSLQHEHIVPVVAVGVTGGEAWLAARWIEGLTLGQRIDRGPLYSERQACELGVRVLEAIAYMHDRGYVHRDIKPDNIMLEKTEWGQRPMLTDFGLAKRVADVRSTVLTSTGTIRGTPRFMPPEQILDSRSAGPLADLFAMGATLHHALAGRWHYSEEGTSIIEAILEGEAVPIRKQRRTLTEGVEAILLRALAKDPRTRFASAREFRDALLTHQRALA